MVKSHSYHKIGWQGRREGGGKESRQIEKNRGRQEESQGRRSKHALSVVCMSYLNSTPSVSSKEESDALPLSE